MHFDKRFESGQSNFTLLCIVHSCQNWLNGLVSSFMAVCVFVIFKAVSIIDSYQWWMHKLLDEKPSVVHINFTFFINLLLSQSLQIWYTWSWECRNRVLTTGFTFWTFSLIWTNVKDFSLLALHIIRFYQDLKISAVLTATCRALWMMFKVAQKFSWGKKIYLPLNRVDRNFHKGKYFFLVKL